MDALIGHSGYVGASLLRQRAFDALYRSTDIHESRGRSFDLVVCAGAPAQKWIANRDPEADERNIDSLIGHLRAIRCSKLVLLSTVDVFVSPVGVTERSPIVTEGLHAYGTNRRKLELAVMESFAEALVIRLAGLVGPGLRKNVIYDLLHDNNVEAIDSRGVFQFYPMVNLWWDIARALEARLSLLHLTAAPVSVAEVAREGFGLELSQERPGTPARYDMRSDHAAIFGGADWYQYSRRESLQAIRAYAQSEPRVARAAG